MMETLESDMGNILDLFACGVTAKSATSQEHELEQMIQANARLTGQLPTPAVVADTADWVAEMHRQAIPGARMTQMEMVHSVLVGLTNEDYDPRWRLSRAVATVKAAIKPSVFYCEWLPAALHGVASQVWYSDLASDAALGARPCRDLTTEDIAGRDSL